MIKINVSRTCAEATQRERLTSGMQGVELSFSFSADWDDLVKTAVFEGSGRRIALTNIGDSCIIPHEVLAKHGGALRVGVYGRTADGSAATPTVYAQLGIIQRGADPNADPSTKPTLPVWAQLQAQIGDLANLTTGDKTNLVAAINEAAKSGGGSKDGTGIESITYNGEDEDGGNVYTVLLTDGSSYEITAPKGAKGDKGDTGAAGPQGPAGAPGKDGASMGITSATVGQIAKITAVDASGVPTAWSPVDMPTGGGETWEKLVNTTLEEAVDTVTYSFKNCKRIKALIAPTLTADVDGWKRITINNVSYPTLSSKVLTIEGICIEVDSEYPPYVKICSGVIKSPSGNGINTGYTARLLENIARNGITQFGCQTAAILTAGTKIEIWGVKS